jgi:hypothetical protein
VARHLPSGSEAPSPAPPRRVDKSPLHIAAKSGDVGILRQLVHQPGFDPNAQDVYGSTALHLACFMGHAAFAELLLGVANIDPNMRDVFHRSPLEHSCRQGHVAVVKLLVAHPRILVNQQNKRGETPLMKCCSYGHEGCALVLLQAGANPNLPDGLYRNTALHRSARKGHVGCVQTLLAHKADPSRCNSDGCNVVHSVLLGDGPNHEVLRALVDFLRTAACTTDCLACKNKRGLTPLGEAQRKADRVALGMLEELTRTSRVAAVLEKPSVEWTPEDVGIWIESLGYPALAPVFVSNDVTGRLLQTIKDEQLNEKLGISSWGIRTNILEARAKLQRTQALPLQPSTSTADSVVLAHLLPNLQARTESQILAWADLQIFEELGRGYFGTVRRAVWRGIEVAV